MKQERQIYSQPGLESPFSVELNMDEVDTVLEHTTKVEVNDCLLREDALELFFMGRPKMRPTGFSGSLRLVRKSLAFYSLNDAEVNEHIAQPALREPMHCGGDDFAAAHFGRDDDLALPFRLDGQEASPRNVGIHESESVQLV